ncbi:LCP family protein [Arthrobacter cavernae]|uniref:LCP family protein n=1 Tax=Arthrobacter cavernae TaxID=2817681 RepID=A0A939KNK6_9MICC|nr:LCP family protein [Arthrobacter cavernae]MBO1267690.1 LCP family protein [Arthrobacter cavernae]
MEPQSDPGGAATEPPPPAGKSSERLRRLRVGAVLAMVLAFGIVIAGIIVNVNRTAVPGSPPSGTSAQANSTHTATPSVSEPPAPPAPAAPAVPLPPVLPGLPTTPMNILLIGSDMRGDARAAAEYTATTGQPSDHRSDSLILIHIPADHQRIYGISIMRDLWVDIPGYGASKINASLEVGGVPLVAQAVGSLLNTRIDHTVMLDFNGLKTLTDFLGGVDVNVTVPFTSTHDTHHYFPAGVNKLDGQAALEFVRERYAFIDGDYQRVRNQQTFVRAIMATLVNSGTLNDPARTLGFITSVAPYLVVDQGFDVLNLAGLAYGLRGVDPGAAVFFTLPTAGTGFSSTGQSILFPDYAGIAAVSAALAEGRLAEYGP